MTITNDVSVEQSPGTSPADEVEAQAGALIEQMFGSVLGALELASIDLGERLGLYAALAEAPGSPAELAQRTGVDQRYVREWCEQQAVAGILTADDNDAPDDRRFTSRSATRSCCSIPRAWPTASLWPASCRSWARSCRRLSTPTARAPVCRTPSTGPRRERSSPSATDRCSRTCSPRRGCPRSPTSTPASRRAMRGVADVACGCGWSSIAIAQAYPGVSVDGFDADEASIATARANAKAAGVDDRVRFEAARDKRRGRYELVCCFESLHDMAEPVRALAAMGAMAGPTARCSSPMRRWPIEFTAPGDPGRALDVGCAASCTACPVGRADEPSAGTGTVMRASTLEALRRGGRLRRGRGAADRARPVALLPPVPVVSRRRPTAEP